MKNLLSIILLLLLGLGCAENNKKPDNPEVIPREKMINILVDIHLLEARISSLSIENDSAKTVYKIYEKKLFEKHGINDSIYLESYNYYMHNLQEMDEIYEIVTDSLEEMERNTRPGR